MTEWHPLRPYDNDDNHCDSHDDDDDDRNNNNNNKEEWKQLNKSAEDRGRNMLTLAAKMPTLNHSSMNDYQHVYEPSDDTYLLVDAIKYDLQFDDDDDDDDDKRDHNVDVNDDDNDDEKEKEMINNIALEIYHQQHQQEIIHRDNDNIKNETTITAVHGRLDDILHNVYEERIKDDIVKKAVVYYLNQNQLTYSYDKIVRKLKQLKNLDEINSVMELGTGSGIPITYLTKRLLMEKQSKPVVFLADDDADGTNNNDTIRMNCKSNDNSNDNDNDNKGLSVIATDLNPFALKFAQRTAEENGIIVIENTNNKNNNNSNNVYIQSIEFVECNLAQPLLNRLQNKVDVILFNPPYVPTEDDEIHGKGIEISWAGGVNGRRIIDHSLSQIATLLRKPYGICYLITVDDNLPLELALKLKNQYHLQMIPLLRRRARNEYLTVQKITWM